MKTLVLKLKDTFGKKPTAEGAVVEHPNFWMYS